MKAVITVMGMDCVGVIAKISNLCSQMNINIEHVTQSIMQDMFCMIMLVNLSKCSVSQEKVREAFAQAGQELKMQVTFTRQEVFSAMHEI